MNATQESEEWRPAVGYEGCYEVSSLGRVRSLDRIDNYRGRLHPGRMLRPTPNQRGYQRHTLHLNGVRRIAYVHRLVASAFCLGEAPGLEVCHGDGNPANNRADNLRWDTRSANHLDQRSHGTHHEGKKTHCKRGHLLAGGNLVKAKLLVEGFRGCLACNRTYQWAKKHQATPEMFKKHADAIAAQLLG